MKKILFALFVVAALSISGGLYYYFNIHSNKMDESLYTMPVSEAQAEISIALDEVMLCKGKAMMGNPEARKCFMAYLERHGQNTGSNIAIGEFFDRVEASEKFKKNVTARKIVMKISRKQDAESYMFKWMEKN